MKIINLLSLFLFLIPILSCNSDGASKALADNETCKSNAIAVAKKSLEGIKMHEDMTAELMIQNTKNAITQIETIDISKCENSFQVKFREFLSKLKAGGNILSKMKAEGEPNSADLSKFEKVSKDMNILWKEIEQMAKK